MSASILKKLPVLLEQSVFSGTGFLINVALVKLMGLEQYGLYASLVLVVYFLLGISQALVVQPMQVHISKVEKCCSYCLFLFFLKLSLILCFSTIIIVVSLADFNFLESSQVYLLPFAAFMASFLGFDFYRKYFLATAQVKMALIITLVYAVSTIGLFLLAFWGQYSRDLITYLYLLILGYLPALAVGTLTYFSALSLPTKKELKEYGKVHIIEGQWLLYAAVVQWFSGNLYLMASGLLIGVEALGVLRFVQSLLGLVNILLQTIENYVLPQLSRAYQLSLQHCYRAFQRSLGIYQLSVLAGLSLLFLFAEDVLRIAGNVSFVPYAYVLRGMLVLYAIIIIAYPIRLLIRVTELNKSYFSAYLVSFLFSLVSYQFLLSHFGVSGAIIGLVINQLILQATWLLVLNKNQFKVWKLYI